MSTELYLDTARLGRMCRGARSAEQQFGRLVGRLGSSLYLERFLAHGFRSLPTRLAHRVSRLECWPGMTGFRLALGCDIGQPVGFPAYFFGQSSSLIRFAAECLVFRARRILVTDLAWPAYVHILRQIAIERGARLTVIPLRHLVISEQAKDTEVVQYLKQACQRCECDGLFLSDITHLGIRLPVEKILAELRSSGPRFVVVDGAQAFHQRPVDLTRLDCDLYLAGTQKWFGAYHPLRIAFVGRSANLASIEATRRSWLHGRCRPDALFDFCTALEDDAFSSYGETVNVSPLIAAAGALAQARSEALSMSDRWQALVTNTRFLADWIGDRFCRPVRPHGSLASGILLVSAKRPGHRFSARARTALARAGVIASTFPDGLVRLSMPRHYLSLYQKTLVARALHSSLT